jgi:hypothetical protein
VPSFTTGPTLLPDIGTLHYNGCTFSPLFVSKLSGRFTQDDAGRTVKDTEIDLLVEGYVTIDGTGSKTIGASISPTMQNMHRLLSAQGGYLKYMGRGWDIVVNIPDSPNKMDVRWGPKPEVIDFQPLGGGLSAKVIWRVTVCIVGSPAGLGFPVWGSRDKRINLLQFNYETSVDYSEDYFSTISMSGSLEIPITRSKQSDRTVPYTADQMRPIIFSQVMRGIDQSRFRITNRSFNVSRDKRTLTWDVTATEKPYMDLPPQCPIARGTYNVKPARAGPGLSLWLCSLSCTYTLRADVPRRQAYLLFLTLLRLRMAQSVKVDQEAPAAPPPPGPVQNAINGFLAVPFAGLFVPAPVAAGVAGAAVAAAGVGRNAILIDFSMSEGIYLDSKSVTFSATWRITCPFSHIMVASGLWTKVRETDGKGANLWALSMADVNGVNSWLDNRLDPSLDIIVDFGS